MINPARQEPLTWRARFEEEITRASSAMEKGLEGQARVCARRAAGEALRHFWSSSSDGVEPASAYDLIRRGSVDPALPERVRQILLSLLERVSPQGEGIPPAQALRDVQEIPCLLGLE